MVNEDTYDDGVNGGDDSSLSRGEHTAVNTAQDDDGGQEGGNGAKYDLSSTLAGCAILGAALIAIFFGEVVAHGHEGTTN